MSALKWDEVGKRLYETGIDRVALFLMNDDGTYANGVAWNGASAVNEKPEGAEPTAVYANNSKYLTLYSAEDFKAGLEAYTYPEEFEECDGSVEIAPGVYVTQQTRRAFGLTYRNLIGNDVKDTKYGYKIHLVYGAKVSPSEKSRSTVNESPEAATFSWDVSTTPVTTTGYDPTAHIVIDSTKVDATKLAEFEAKLYGSDTEESTLMLPDEVIEFFKESTEETTEG